MHPELFPPMKCPPRFAVQIKTSRQRMAHCTGCAHCQIPRGDRHMSERGRGRGRAESKGHGRPSPAHAAVAAQQSGGWTSINGFHGRDEDAYRHAEGGTNGSSLCCDTKPEHFHTHPTYKMSAVHGADQDRLGREWDPAQVPQGDRHMFERGRGRAGSNGHGHPFTAHAAVAAQRGHQWVARSEGRRSQRGCLSPCRVQHQ